MKICIENCDLFSRPVFILYKHSATCFRKEVYHISTYSTYSLHNETFTYRSYPDEIQFSIQAKVDFDWNSFTQLFVISSKLAKRVSFSLFCVLPAVDCTLLLLTLVR